MDTVQTASAPQTNATVMASAGTGKTWLLVTRLIRLLLSGADPGAILAVTFTRKAAAEMQGRLRERLYEYLTMDDGELARNLSLIGLDGSGGNLSAMRHLFEKLLRHERPARITTYHAFCQDVLHRFPFDAGVPPGFDVVENTGLLVSEAWDALITETTAHPDGETAAALRQLLDYHGSIDGPRQALETFLNHRIDWWAYTQGQRDPVAHAVATLTRRLDIDPQADPERDFLGGDTLSLTGEFMELLEKHPTDTNLRHAGLLRQAGDPARPAREKIRLISEVFLTQKGQPRARKESGALRKAMGEKGLQRFLRLHGILCGYLERYLEQQKRQLTLRINQAWYRAGQALLDHYMRIKAERRQLDFADLEWHTYLLLRHSDQALWVQYKLDHRIDHFLVDEFQDTNPTQWAMLLPLLEELAAGGGERRRSVFLVGDGKQSIYRFRRANPRLFHTADTWLREHLQAVNCTLDTSRRSAPAIIDFVNRLFSSEVLGQRLPSFHAHGTHLRGLWGRVEMLPLIQAQAEPEEQAVENHGRALRNPLLEPRPCFEDDPHFSEGVLIAQRIRDMVNGPTVLTTQGRNHEAGYSDITILVRSRTHIHHYERALRHAGIPYLGGGRTTLLDCLEIQDMVALLELLVAPYNNLALACVLRSPLFQCGDEDLIFLAQRAQRGAGGTWFDILEAQDSDELAQHAALQHARERLCAWRELAGQLPVHDLLDRIYCDANVIQRYCAAFPPALRSRARGNLTRFIEMALEVDSGRYPSLAHFLTRIRALRQYDDDALEEAPHLEQKDAVRIMTIHAAKGLEAPIVFLADSARPRRRPGAYELLLEWPGEADRPVSFHLGAKRDEMDQWSRQLRDKAEEEDIMEETNLLYVALTRARQWLIISGCMPRRNHNLGWYGDMAAALDNDGDIGTRGFVLESGAQPEPPPARPVETGQAPSVDPRLSRPLDIPPMPVERSPSALADDTTEDSATFKPVTPPANEAPFNRGLVIHRMLDLLTRDEGTGSGGTLTCETLARDLGLGPRDPALLACWDEAQAVIRNEALRPLFDAAHFQRAINEAPLIYEQDGHIVNGIIDRLVIADTLTLIDYKTHRHARPDNLAQLAAPYRQQMEHYARGVKKLWPGKPLRVLLLFTACAGIVEMEAAQTNR